MSSCKERICVLENELSDIEATFAHEKHEIEDILEKAGKDPYIKEILGDFFPSIRYCMARDHKIVVDTLNTKNHPCRF